MFNALMQNHQNFSIDAILRHDGTELEKQRLYIATMNTFTTKQEIAKNFDPTRFSINLELDSVRPMIIHFLQCRNAMFS